MYLKYREKKKIHKILTTSLKIWTLPLTNISYTNHFPMSMATLIFKTTSSFCHEWQMVSISSRHPVIAGWASISIIIIIIVIEVIVIILGCLGRRKGDSTKPPRRACHLVIWLTRVFTWHNSSLRVSRRASICWSCAMIASRVTPLEEEEGAKVDRAEEVGGAAICV